VRQPAVRFNRKTSQIPGIGWKRKEFISNLFGIQPNLQSAESRGIFPSEARKPWGILANAQSQGEVDKEILRTDEVRLDTFYTMLDAGRIHNPRPQGWQRQGEISPNGAHRGDRAKIFNKIAVLPP
jgi:hypothetical protein